MDATTISGNDQLGSLAYLPALRSGLELAIVQSNAITDFSGLSIPAHLGSLEIKFNANLTSLEGLENCQSLAENLNILMNPSLVELTGLDTLATVGSMLAITDNHALSNACAYQLIRPPCPGCDYSSANFITATTVRQPRLSVLIIVGWIKRCAHHKTQNIRRETNVQSPGFTSTW